MTSLRTESVESRVSSHPAANHLKFAGLMLAAMSLVACPRTDKDGAIETVSQPLLQVDKGSTFPSTSGSTTEGNLFRQTGGAKGLWMDNGANSYVQVSGGVANVQDFGAKPDDSTDDSSAINAAIDSLAAGPTGGGVVVIPPGNYTLGSPVMLKKTVSLVGSGRENTFLTNGATTGFVAIDTPEPPTPPAASTQWAWASIRDLTIKFTTDSLGHTCIRIHDSVQFSLERVQCAFVWGGSGYNASKGLHIKATHEHAQEKTGHASIRDFYAYFLDTVGESHPNPGTTDYDSRGIFLDGAEDVIEGVVIDGHTRIENFNIGVYLKTTYNSSIGGVAHVSGSNVANLVLADSQENVFTRLRFSHAGPPGEDAEDYEDNCQMGGSWPGSGCHIALVGTPTSTTGNYGNTFIHPTFSLPTAAGNTYVYYDNGARTTWILTNASNLNAATTFPANVRVPDQVHAALAVGGVATTDSLSSLATFRAPNANWGMAASFFADSVDRGITVASNDFNNAGDDGKRLWVGPADIGATRDGTTIFSPVKFTTGAQFKSSNSSSDRSALLLKSPNGTCYRVTISDGGTLTTSSSSDCVD